MMLAQPRVKRLSHFCRLSLRESSAGIRYFRGAKGDDVLHLANKITAGPRFSEGAWGASQMEPATNVYFLRFDWSESETAS